MKKLTLAEAWMELADDWSEPIIDSVGFWVSSKWHSGICEGINKLRLRDMIDDSKMRDMRSEVDLLPDYGLEGYKWGHREEDAKLREQFCREQAILAQKKEGLT